MLQSWHFKWRHSPLRTLLALLFCAAAPIWVFADDFIIAPNPSPTEIGTIYPFLIKEICQYCTNKPTMRYQQVYNASLFTNASPGSIYVTTVSFGMKYPPTPLDWTVPSMQINLSTTPKTADNLSLVFAENVGPDDTTVLDRTSHDFPANNQLIVFNRPFRYTPPLGNLLLDVRVFDGSGDPFPPSDPFPQMAAYTSPTDETSRVWATNVMAATASASDSAGLYTVVELSPIPSLQAQFIPSMCTGCPTNVIVISWPYVPTNFVLQVTRQLGAHASWGPVTNQIFKGAFAGLWIEIPAASAGSQSFYRLVWPNGYDLTTTVKVPKAVASNFDGTIH